METKTMRMQKSIQQILLQVLNKCTRMEIENKGHGFECEKKTTSK